MEKIAWVTDTSALLSNNFIKKFNIHVIPIVVIIDKNSYQEALDLSYSKLYEKLRNSKTGASTSQPILGEMVELYKKLKAEGYTSAIAIHPSSKLSNTYASAFLAAKDANFPVYPIDSKMISYPMMKMIERGQKLEKEGLAIEEILMELNKMPDQAQLIGIPDNLTQLHKSGRVPGIAAFIGNLLNLKLIIAFQDGQVVLKNKVRTLKKAKQYVINILRKELTTSKISEVAIVHCNNLKEAEIWKEEILVEFPSLNTIIMPLSAAIGVHAGEGTTGLSWIRDV